MKEIHKIITEIEIGNINEAPIDMQPLQPLFDEFQKAGYKRTEYETMGYQVDFWAWFQKGPNTLCIAGSLWYGNFNISRAEQIN